MYRVVVAALSGGIVFAALMAWTPLQACAGSLLRCHYGTATQTPRAPAAHQSRISGPLRAAWVLLCNLATGGLPGWNAVLRALVVVVLMPVCIPTGDG